MIFVSTVVIGLIQYVGSSVLVTRELIFVAMQHMVYIPIL